MGFLGFFKKKKKTTSAKEIAETKKKVEGNSQAESKLPTGKDIELNVGDEANNAEDTGVKSTSDSTEQENQETLHISTEEEKLSQEKPARTESETGLPSDTPQVKKTAEMEERKLSQERPRPSDNDENREDQDPTSESQQEKASYDISAEERKLSQEKPRDSNLGMPKKSVKELARLAEKDTKELNSVQSVSKLKTGGSKKRGVQSLGGGLKRAAKYRTSEINLFSTLTFNGYMQAQKDAKDKVESANDENGATEVSAA